ncbi:MAG: DUF4105 domain-containing protein [Myxococcota bacterium]|jgi:hypothetical protein|nr:DUF4105 domain-containing protein [Myxococcota bacterium]
MAREFGADVDDDNALIYAFKGIVGSDPARFRKLAYAYKVRQYADYESRDLWEYRLALSPRQLEMLVGHLWELGPSYFDDDDFTENCSYHILGAIAAAVPEAGLLDRVRMPVIPADTVKTLAETPGLVEDIAFHPSLRSTFFSRAASLDAEAQEVIAVLVDDPHAPPAPDLGRNANGRSARHRGRPLRHAPCTRTDRGPRVAARADQARAAGSPGGHPGASTSGREP